MVETLERVDRLRRRLMDVDQPLVGADLEVLARVLVLERAADDAVDVLLGRKRHGTRDRRAGARRGLNDLARRLLDRRSVVGLEPDPDLVLRESRHDFESRGTGLILSLVVPRAGPTSARPGRVSRKPRAYSMMDVTTPEPTVRPPSRMAKRRPSSMASG